MTKTVAGFQNCSLSINKMKCENICLKLKRNKKWAKKFCKFYLMESHSLWIGSHKVLPSWSPALIESCTPLSPVPHRVLPSHGVLPSHCVLPFMNLPPWSPARCGFVLHEVLLLWYPATPRSNATDYESQQYQNRTFTV